MIKEITGLIGNTPLLRLSRLEEHYNLEASIYAKMEFLNPGGSVKDRIALAMIEAAEKEGIIKKGGTIIEATSGNTGIGLAWIGAYKGYSVILTMPESMSLERRNLLAAYGAKLVLTPAAGGMKAAIQKALELKAEIKNSFIPSQFENLANPQAHRQSTALEILRDMEHQVDAFVAGVGTGGTITGVGEVLKKEIPGVRVIAVEPSDSAVLSGNPSGPHKIQGIGAGFVPKTLNCKVYDEIIQIQYADAKKIAMDLAAKEGVLVGVSSAANVWASILLAKRPEYKGKKIVTILCDTGERYLSTELFLS